jgi:hypothetical protein
MRRTAQTGALLCLALLLVAMTASLQVKLTSFKDKSWHRERMSYLPATDRLKPFLFGFETVYADYLWIRTMLHFGGQVMGDKEFQWLGQMVDMVTQLNPHFYPAYEFAGVILPGYGRNPDRARLILQRGLTHVGTERYQIPFYLGWIHYNSEGNMEAAAQYVSLAARHPDAPPFLTGLAASLYRKAGKEDLSRHFLGSLYSSSENPAVQEVVRQKLRQLGDEPEGSPGDRLRIRDSASDTHE